MTSTELKSSLESKVQAISQPQETAITVPKSDYIALSGDTLDIVRENLKHQPLNLQLFDVVKSPSGGATVFAVPGVSGEEAEKELTGIILDYTTPRAYWDTPDPVEGTPPVCLSRDSVVSESGQSCAHCPYNDFGSKDGETGAKACKESVLLFLLRPNNVFPQLVRIPVTSKMRFLKYTTRLINKLTPINGVVTKISLEKATSKGGKPYALFNFEAVSTLSPEDVAKAREFAKEFMKAVDTSQLDESLPEAG